MTARKRPLPSWPKMMRRATAAAYLDLTEALFTQEVNAGRLPPPVLFAGKEAWAQVQIDRVLDMITGDSPPASDWRRNSKLYENDPFYRPERR